MRKLVYIAVTTLMLGAISCKKQEDVLFEGFGGQDYEFEDESEIWRIGNKDDGIRYKVSVKPEDIEVWR